MYEALCSLDIPKQIHNARVGAQHLIRGLGAFIVKCIRFSLAFLARN